ncbi:MAG: O-methyltransferase [Cryomorphaceae bacterium]|nr:MAG: O-methyltransferase [Cryomorphaceae bacterium]
MDFLPPEIEQYALNHTSHEPEYLNELNRQTHLRLLQPRMLSGHMQGRILSMLSHMIGPRRILEIGTYSGYSALCMAEGMAPDGELHTIDINEELAPIVNEYIAKAGMQGRIHPHFGDALQIIPSLDGAFDLVFIDADKTNYSAYYDLVIDRIPSGGFLIADNVLWSGKVLDPEESANDPDTSALIAFNKKISTDPRIEHVLMPVRDGLMVIRKK